MYSGIYVKKVFLGMDKLVSMPGSDSLQSGLKFYCRCFFSISMWDLWDMSADQRKILHAVQY